MRHCEDPRCSHFETAIGDGPCHGRPVREDPLLALIELLKQQERAAERVQWLGRRIALLADTVKTERGF